MPMAKSVECAFLAGDGRESQRICHDFEGRTVHWSFGRNTRLSAERQKDPTTYNTRC